MLNTHNPVHRSQIKQKPEAKKKKGKPPKTAMYLEVSLEPGR